MVTQSLLWHSEQQSFDFAELCNALYERELRTLASSNADSITNLQGRMKSLPHYVKRTAYVLLNTDSPLNLDVHNANWSAKQANNIPSISQLSDYQTNVMNWYKRLLLNEKLAYGLIVPVAIKHRIVLDCIDRIDAQKQRFRTNVYGWFYVNDLEIESTIASNINQDNCYLLKPTKRVMTAACVGHCWKNGKKVQPIIPSLRELLLSCAINWRNFAKPATPNN